MLILQKEITNYIAQFINDVNATNKFLVLNLHRNDNDCIVYIDTCLFGLLGLGQKYKSEYKNLLYQLNNMLINHGLDKYFTLLIRSENSFSIELKKDISKESFDLLITLLKLKRKI